MDYSRVFVLLFNLFRSMSVIVTFAYVLSRINGVKYIFKKKFNKYEKTFLFVFFSILSILGTYMGIIIMDAYANIRGIGALVGGLVGGPLIGFAVGLTSGLHRFSLGGFTALACAVGTTLTGLIGGYFHQKYLNDEINFKNGFLIGGFALVIEMIIVLIFSRPFALAVDLVQIIAIPMVFSNALGIAIFISILNNVKEEHQKIRALQAEKVLSIADRSLPIIQSGLDSESAAEIIKMIKEESGADAVAITDKKQVLAFVGSGDDHHFEGEKIKTEASKKALKEETTIVIDEKGEINCANNKCPLANVVITPLKIENSVYGLLKLYRINKKISVLDIKMAEGIANLLATQIKLFRLSKQAELKSEAELKALQTQINPHFLFNSMNTISALCRNKPKKARNLLIKLAGIFRRTLKRDIHQITLKQEIDFSKDYLSIEKARLGSRLEVEWNIEADLMDYKIPPFIIQPLIENSIKHGIYPLKEGGKVETSIIKENDSLKIVISDNGIGVSEKDMDDIFNSDNNSIGLKNIKERLQSVYGNSAKLKISSNSDYSFKNIIKIPLTPLMKGEE
ncbi:LytS/YhcK type 5TM receptor domain-containing protein [Halanaerobium hydrogeniformans]|uniref:histidine kinase n=1 Tax=Halanaerobium hydrogeniformans TaxID=656519 RepID=E4RLZ1_HALHG|nr:LytS/YhcK type 5TM receptor domain-containing protein [Halanaerobium hydrogeniformans]ADQ14074.1 signal transduction histidine kinase, LytS [Halanaerobium hydrogeniformans]